MIRFYLFRIHWLWKHRTWRDVRQKFKAMERDWKKYEAARKEREK